MWFYKIDGVLDGFTFPEDRGTRSRAAQEFQSNQTLFSKKLQSKCYVTVSQIKSQKITLAAVSRESYNVLARCDPLSQCFQTRIHLITLLPPRAGRARQTTSSRNTPFKVRTNPHQ